MNCYKLDAITACKLHPFGSVMPGRNYSGSDYRYGFNGKEKVDEVIGVTGATYDYGFRIYDSRLGRFLSVDPLANKFAFYTPYQFAGNRVIVALDLDGREDIWFHEVEQEDGTFLRTMEEFELDKYYNKMLQNLVHGEVPSSGEVTTRRLKSGETILVSVNPVLPTVTIRPPKEKLGFLMRADQALNSIKGNNLIKSAGFSIKGTQDISNFGTVENETKIFGRTEDNLAINNTTSLNGNINSSNLVNPSLSIASNIEISMFVDTKSDGGGEGINNSNVTSTSLQILNLKISYNTSESSSKWSIGATLKPGLSFSTGLKNKTSFSKILVDKPNIAGSAQ
jgi:RHS repeat-associated protein